MSKKYPLEIVLRHTGSAELLDGDDNTLWSSDEDPEFRETISQEFLTEDDVDDILAYLEDSGNITPAECARFESDEWDVTEESLTDEDVEKDSDEDFEDDDVDDDGE